MKYIFTLLLTVSLYGQSTEQIKNQIKNSGLSKEQLKNVVRNQGVSSDKIKSELDSRGIELDTDFNKASTNKSDNSINEIDPFIEEKSSIDNKDEIIIESVDNSNNSNLDHFGYKIFKGDPDAFQSSNYGAIDPNYNIGPGDQIIVMLWGESQFRQEFLIDREGYIFVPEVGQIFVNGLTLEDLEKKLFQIFSKAYSTLNPANGNPTTYIDVSIGNLRPLRIIVLGEVSQPGAYSVNPSTSLSSSLYYFNGPQTNGSLRDIRLIRRGKVVGKIDFYDYLLSGNIPNDFRLQMDDVVFIPSRGKTVSIYGQINRAGIYEINEDEGLIELIDLAGGLSVNAYTIRAQIDRIIPQNDRAALGMDRMLIDIDFDSVINNKNNIKIIDGDIIEIFAIDEEQKNYVNLISSSVSRPGKYQITKGMTVNDLINKSDGLLNDAYLDLAHIKRINKDLTFQLISIDLKEALDNNIEHNIDLKFMDELFIYNNNEINNNFNSVYIYGPIKNQGRYNLESEKTLGDLIIKAGGFNENIYKVKISIARQDLDQFNPILFSFPNKSKGEYYNTSEINNSNSPLNSFKLNENDIVNIYSSPKNNMPKLASISGAVYFPGEYPILSSDEKVSDLIKRAGGFLPNAYPIASTFMRENKIIKLSFNKIVKNPNSKENFKLMENDKIFISKRSNIVNVLGEVNQPGFYKYYPGYNLKDYIKISGGLTNNADKRQIWITYPNGESKQFKGMLSLPIKVLDGSIITIGAEEDTEPLDKTELAKEVASIFSDFLQIALTLSILSNSTN